ncbi:MAG: hypothetical protein KDJ80_15905 [Nitratireductor sp.]|nr:hypothetical protein [Nitratireductor sp.]
MLKMLVAAIAVSAAVTGAAALTVQDKTAPRAGEAVAQASRGHVDCRNQVWPNIDGQCLGHVSKRMEVRVASRVVAM